jgi:hypothetical protein
MTPREPPQPSAEYRLASQKWSTAVDRPKSRFVVKPSGHSESPFLLFGANKLSMTFRWYRLLKSSRRKKYRNLSTMLEASKYDRQLITNNPQFFRNLGSILDMCHSVYQDIFGRSIDYKSPRGLVSLHGSPAANPPEPCPRAKLYNTFWAALEFYNCGGASLSQTASKFGITYSQLKNFSFKVKNSHIGLVPLFDKRKSKPKMLNSEVEGTIMAYAQACLPNSFSTRELHAHIRRIHPTILCSGRTLQRCLNGIGFKYGALSSVKIVNPDQNNYKYNYLYFHALLQG